MEACSWLEMVIADPIYKLLYHPWVFTSLIHIQDVICSQEKIAVKDLVVKEIVIVLIIPD